MKRRRPKPANFDYDFTNLAVEITGDALYLINGGAEVENSIAAQANAQVGDTVTNSRGETHTLTQGDINWAKDQIGSSGQNTGSSSPSSQPTPSSSSAGSSVQNSSNEILYQSGNKTFSRNEIDKIMERNPGVYANREELLEEFKNAENFDSGNGVGAGFKSMDSAALYWAKTYADDSVISGHELASSIFSADDDDGNTMYFYNTPWEGTEVYDGKGNLIKKKSWINRDSGFSEELNIYYNVRAVSAIHSHARWLSPNSEGPSDDDRKGLKKEAEDLNSLIGKEYLVTPGGFLKEFNINGLIGDGIVSNDIFKDVRMNFSEEIVPVNKSRLGNFMMKFYESLYKNAYYHPDTFIAYGDY